MEQVEEMTKDPGTTEEMNETIIEDTHEDSHEEDIHEGDVIIEDQAGEDPDEPAQQQKAQEQPAEDGYLERLQRTLAEFDNYRKRTDKEKSAMYDLGLTNTVLTILPVLDNFERALEAPCTDHSYVKGMEMIYKQMIDLLDSIGVTQIEAKGQQFDTNIHNAVMHVEDDQYGENEIIQEMQKGYIYKHDKVIRHSMVQVAN